jgi:hypothetical protein
VDYSDLVSLFLFIFALVGLMRGWYKEGITFLFAASLAFLVWRPEAAYMVIKQVTEVMKALIMFIRVGLNPEAQALAEPVDDTGTLLDPDSYKIYVIIAVVMLAVSYIVGEVTFKQRMTALGRILGAGLGALNGYIVISLIKQFIIDRVQAQAAVPLEGGDFAIQVTEVPTSSIFTGAWLILIIIVAIGVIALIVAGDRLKLPLK